MMRGIVLGGLLAVCALAAAGALAAGACADEAPPQWTVTAVSRPTDFAPGDNSGEAHYLVKITNSGGEASDGSIVTISDSLPSGLTLAPAGASGSDLLSGRSLECSGSACTYSGTVVSGDVLTVEVPVEVSSSAPASVTNVVSVSGGGAEQVSTSTPTAISTGSPPWGLAPGSSGFQLALSSDQAGAHPDMLTTFNFDTGPEGQVFGDLKDTVVRLPPGFAGDPQAVPTCLASQLVNIRLEDECPVETQVGTAHVVVHIVEKFNIDITSPLYNLPAQPGEVARLGFNSAIATTNLVVTVRPDYGLEVTSPNLIGYFSIQSVAIDVWGVPAEHRHDPWRDVECDDGSCENLVDGGPGLEAESKPVPYLSNPTQCTTEPLNATLSVDSYVQRGVFQSRSQPIGPMSGCERLRFDPAFSVVPTTTSVSSPTGLNVELKIPQTYGDASALATPHMKDARVVLPRGMTLNPSAGAGLSVCTPEQYGSETASSPPGSGCPDSSELGTARIHTPVLREEGTGYIYLAQPYDNPFKSLLAIYLVIRIPQRGVIVKVAGETVPDPLTGQLVTTFDDDPPLPFDEFTLSFLQGQTSPFASPPTCGQYTAQAEMTSWSEPGEVSLLQNSFPIDNGRGGSACPAGGAPPFAPRVVAGSENDDAGSYSPFYLRVSRQDGEQEIEKFSTVLPPGLSGNLSGIPFCPDARIALAKTETGGQETAEPSCPAASEIGHTLVGAGVGAVLAQAPGKVYLAGPYHGSALSVVSITSATVGPFDLGTVVIRFALRINPLTAQVEIDSAGSDPIPHIVDGIVMHVRDIRVYIDRSKFVMNPTSCDPMSIEATVTGAGADFTNPADAYPVSMTTPFQAADCSSLGFKPLFKASTSGRTSRSAGASLSVKLSYPAGSLGAQANIAKVKVDLPRQLPARLTTLQKACPDRVFDRDPAACPAGSRVGSATALTPIVPEPLSGPAYFVSHGGARFPELAIVLSGYGISVQLHGETFIDERTGITSSTFRSVPDVPIGTFTLTLPQGPNSALAANGDLCAARLTMPTAFTAQNGTAIHRSTPIAVTGCGRHKLERAKRKAGRHAKKG